MIDEDVYWMQRALSNAQLAEQHQEVPIGAVIILNQQLIAEGYNQPIETHDPTAHAEIVALRRAAQTMQNYRLLNTTLYVTLEPCPMCVAAMVHARIARCVYGALDPKTGAAGSVISLQLAPTMNHHVQMVGGVLAAECGAILQEFFKRRS